MVKLGIQAIVNTMGVAVAAAFAVVNRIDDFAYTPEQNIGHAMTALMAQSKGAGKDEPFNQEAFRCRHCALKWCTVSSFLSSAFVFARIR